jgi:hypothetical protein
MKKVPFKITNTSLNTNQKETTQEASKGKLLKKLPEGNYSRNFMRETTQETS